MKQITQEKEAYLPLLLLADPEEKMIDIYLAAGELWALTAAGGETIGVAVVVALDEKRCELKNLAVAPQWQNKGHGSAMVAFLIAHYAQKGYEMMLVGTADDGVTFYKPLGFTYHHTVSGFFTDHYSEPIWENGRQCVDMIYLSRFL